MLFPAPVITIACQPTDAFLFESINSQSLSKVERTHLELQGSQSKIPVHDRIKRMMRVTPTGKGKTAKCSISLSSGYEVGLNIIPRRDVSKPFVELKHASDRTLPITDGSNNQALNLLRSSLLGKPNHFLTDHADYKRHRHDNYSYTTDFATYRLQYAGTDNRSLSVWHLRLKIKSPSNYDDAATVKEKEPLVYYSSLQPEKDNFKSGQWADLHLVTGHDVSFSEIRRVLR